MEAAMLPLDWMIFSPYAPEGDGSPVLFIPGFCAGDVSTGIMQGLVKAKGYRTFGWDAGINTGFQDRKLLKLERRFLEISDQSQMPVALVGHSLGGIFARELGKKYPERVSKVVTVGSPFGAAGGTGGVATPARLVFEFMHAKNRITNDAEFQKSVAMPPPVPTTSIYSETDGVVHWSTCLNPETSLSENIEINSSHTGLIVRGKVALALLDRLAEPVEGWRKFRPEKYPVARFTKPAALSV